VSSGKSYKTQSERALIIFSCNQGLGWALYLPSYSCQSRLFAFAPSNLRLTRTAESGSPRKNKTRVLSKYLHFFEFPFPLLRHIWPCSVDVRVCQLVRILNGHLLVVRVRDLVFLYHSSFYARWVRSRAIKSPLGYSVLRRGFVAVLYSDFHFN
jgi:hypothetical protein